MMKDHVHLEWELGILLPRTAALIDEAEERALPIRPLVPECSSNGPTPMYSQVFTKIEFALKAIEYVIPV